MGRSWDDFKKNFPWKAMTIGFLIPKGMLFAGISLKMLFAGALSAVLWCVTVFTVSVLRDRKANVFAIIALAMIFMRIAVILASKSPELYMIAQAVDSSLYAAAFFVSLLFPSSLVQVLAEASGLAMPRSIRASPYYNKAWRIITVVWGAGFALMALLLLIMRLISMRAAVIGDMLLSWPLMVFLVAFTVIFPRRYWGKTIGEAQVREI